MKLWATEYMEKKEAEQKTAEGIWNAVAGGIPYSIGVRQAVSEHPELSEREAERAGGGVMRPMVGAMRSIPYALVGGLGGAALGAGAHALGLPDEAIPVGAIGGALGAGIYGNYQEGKGLTEEEIAEMDKPQRYQTSTLSRHPISGTLGAATLPFAALGAASNPVGTLISHSPQLLVGGVQDLMGRPRS